MLKFVENVLVPQNDCWDPLRQLRWTRYITILKASGSKSSWNLQAHTYVDFHTVVLGRRCCELWNREGKQVCRHLWCGIKSSGLPLVIYNRRTWGSENKAHTHTHTSEKIFFLWPEATKPHAPVRSNTFFLPDFFPFPTAIVFHLWIMVTVNTAFISGSSKQGNTFLALVGSIWVAARYLQKGGTFITFQKAVWIS